MKRAVNGVLVTVTFKITSSSCLLSCTAIVICCHNVLVAPLLILFSSAAIIFLFRLVNVVPTGHVPLSSLK